MVFLNSKRNVLLSIIFSLFLLPLSLSADSVKKPVPVPGEGGVSGGGGADPEMRVFEIRQELLQWIDESDRNGGGARDLQFSEGMNFDIYKSQMNAFLRSEFVVVSFRTLQEESKITDPQEKISVEGEPKECRGSFSNKDFLFHIRCIKESFASLPEWRQYRLIHHEFAGLAGLEKNIGAASDYSLSIQVVKYLETKTVQKLSTKNSGRSSRVEKVYPSNSLCAIKLKGAQITSIVYDSFERTYTAVFVYIEHPSIEGGKGYFSASFREDFAKLSERALASNLPIDLVLSSNWDKACNSFENEFFNVSPLAQTVGSISIVRSR